MAPQNRVELSLADAMEKVGTLMQVQAEEKGINFTVQAIHRPLIKANPEQIHQVWSNLISNAIKYTGSTGSVRVVLEEQDGFAIGTVEDTGIGISPEEQDRLFMEFYRSPRAKDMKIIGTGLGLALVKRIIDGYHGTISVESAINKGSRFRFRIPVAGTAMANRSES
jgi:two-component system phosphate regulon sensor histidine kinase PhoR